MIGKSLIAPFSCKQHSFIPLAFIPDQWSLQFTQPLPRLLQCGVTLPYRGVYIHFPDLIPSKCPRILWTILGERPTISKAQGVWQLQPMESQQRQKQGPKVPPTYGAPPILHPARILLPEQENCFQQWTQQHAGDACGQSLCSAVLIVTHSHSPGLQGLGR